MPQRNRESLNRSGGAKKNTSSAQGMCELLNFTKKEAYYHPVYSYAVVVQNTLHSRYKSIKMCQVEKSLQLAVLSSNLKAPTVVKIVTLLVERMSDF